MAGSQFALTILLGRLIDTSGLGVYYLFVAWLYIFGACVNFGIPSLILRQIPAIVTRNKYSEAFEFWKNCLIFTILITLPFAFVLNIYSIHFAQLFLRNQELHLVFQFLGLAITPFSIVCVSGATLKSFKRPVFSVIIEFGIVPLCLLTLSAYHYVNSVTLQIKLLFFSYLVALYASALIGTLVIIALFKSGNSNHAKSIKLKIINKIYIPSSQYFWFVTLFTQGITNLPFIILPHFASQSEIGLFGVANRLVSLAALILATLSSVYAPLFSEWFERKRSNHLKQLLRETQFYSFFAYLPLFSVFIFAADWTLSLFGSGFVAAKPYLYILAFGQLINSFTGLAGIINIMTNSERFELNINAFTFFFAILLSVIGGALFGAFGIAIAMSLSLAGKNIMSYMASIERIKAI